MPVHVENLILGLFLLVFVMLAVVFLLRMLRYGGWKAALFGAAIRRCLGEAVGSGPLSRMSVRVHRLDGETAGKTIGLEFVARGWGSYRMVPLALSRAEAQKLVQMIQSGLSDPGGTVIRGGRD